jgi:hypothetical protein
MDNRNSILYKLNTQTCPGNLIIILGAKIHDNHVLNYFNTLDKDTTIICIDIDPLQGNEEQIKRLVQITHDFNHIGLWKLINSNCEKLGLVPHKVIVDWSTAKFLSGNFAINMSYGVIMKIITSWISVFSCELYSPYSHECCYIISVTEKVPDYYKIYPLNICVAFDSSTSFIDEFWINELKAYVKKEQPALNVVDFSENMYPLMRINNPVTKFLKLLKN